jgi:uracil-DNA glycosylase
MKNWKNIDQWRLRRLINRRFDYAQQPIDQLLNFFPYTCLSNTHIPMPDVKIEASWKAALAEEFEKPYFQALIDFLKKEKAAGKVIFPPGPLIFNAFECTPIDAVKVVILGQDPYHNPGEAMGLSFSVPKGVRVPPSLKNIYQELFTDLQIPKAEHGDLSNWARQGVFLLNTMLTVEQKQAGSHQKAGWHFFTDAVIQTLSEKREHLVFMLWGNPARKKAELIDGNKHLILEAAHPSPLAGGAFFNCKHFSKANAYLKEHGMEEINWKV